MMAMHAAIALTQTSITDYATGAGDFVHVALGGAH
jgi:hypothetical protein